MYALKTCEHIILGLNEYAVLKYNHGLPNDKLFAFYTSVNTFTFLKTQ